MAIVARPGLLLLATTLLLCQLQLQVQAQQKCNLVACDAAKAVHQQWDWTLDAWNHLKLASNGFCLDVDSYGTTPQSNVWVYACHPDDKDPKHQNQGWKQQGNQILSIYSNLCVDVAPAPGYGTWLMGCSSSPSQVWSFNKTDSTIRHTQTGLCLTAGYVPPPVNPCLGVLKDKPCCDLTLSFQARAADLVSRIDGPSKINLLDNTAGGVPAIGLPPYEWWSEALHGVAYSPGVTFFDPVPYATSFPQVILTAASFDKEMFHAIGLAISTEARAISNVGQAGLTYWAPNLNIYRDPRWGRGQETPGEDPVLTAEYVANFVTGLQGPDPKYLKVSSCCKHYAAYSLEDWKGMDRYHFNAVVSPQDMTDTYLPAFQACVQRGKASSIMCSYNSINGIPSCANKAMLTDTVRGKWGFQGYITGDCGAVDCVQNSHHYTNNSDDTCKDVLDAGTDIDCGSFLKGNMANAVAHGKVQWADVDKALVNLFLVQFRLGMFDPFERQSYRHIPVTDVNSPLHQALALEAAREGIVLLKNTNGSLPLNRFTVSTLAVVGPNAAATDTMQGNYFGAAPYLITPVQGFQRFVPNVKYAQGCDISGTSTAGFPEAVAAAQTSDATVIVIGINQDIESEGKDRIDIGLPGVQDRFVAAVAAASKGPVIVVLMAGGPVDISAIRDNAKVAGIIWVGYPGQSGGQAIAETIFGDNNPAGRLPVTYHRTDYVNLSLQDMNMRPNTATGNPGRTYRFFTGTPVFEFGFGLSYTTFTYKWSGPSAASAPLQAGALIDAGVLTCLVTNTGNRQSDTVVLAFLVPPTPGKDGQPLKFLVDFARLNLMPNQARTVTFPVRAEMFELANDAGEMVKVTGEWRVKIEDLELSVIV